MLRSVECIGNNGKKQMALFLYLEIVIANLARKSNNIKLLSSISNGFEFAFFTNSIRDKLLKPKL
ncbi:MAG: hypothetical protein DSY80_05105 [Desulfocapsa sp.]|nr:MAG: hypothetical protein DSY80_05105 [Desulfocapsa sp.]